jgi:tRNA nucleotidyltransferase/poly(A) polymerase
MKKEILEVLNILENNGFEAYVVGGFTRDFYLGKISNDYDICTNATPDIVMKLFNVLEEKHGSMKVSYQGIICEITTYRIEFEYINRNPKIMYSEDLKVDLLRRDFTINTICLNSEMEYIDLYGGIDDLNKCIIKIVGNGLTKIKEDPLRVLRAIRFSTVLDFEIDNELDLLLSENSYLVKDLTYFRKKEELDKIFTSNNIDKGINLLKKYLLDEYLEIDIHNIIPISDKSAMWAQINYSVKYQFSKQEKKEMEIIKTLLKTAEIGSYEIYRYGLKYCKKAAEIRKIDLNKIGELSNNLYINKREDIDISIFDIKSNTSMNISDVFILIEKAILEEKIRNNKNEIIKFISIIC